jgi:hypothetical protein
MIRIGKPFRTLGIFAALLLAALPLAGTASAQTYSLQVSVKVLFSDGTPFQGKVQLNDITSGTSIPVQHWMLDSSGSATAAISLGTAHVYQVQLIGLSGLVRESATLYPVMFPSAKSAAFTFRLSRTFMADGKTYVISGLAAGFDF